MKVSLPLKDQEARILLTSRCNYRCVFCHGEGLGDVSAQRWVPDIESTLSIVDSCLAAGCRDITLTGGEPLLEPEIALAVVERVAKKAADALVTIVSNAALLRDDWLDRLPPFGNLRFNISLHTDDPAQYLRVTGQNRITVEDIRDRLALLRKHGIPFKLNAVALRDLADSGHFARLCDFAAREGAVALKILELLIMEQSEALFPEYLALETIEKRLPSGFVLSRRTPRRQEYRAPGMDFTLELQKCRCRFGCRNCLTETTGNFSSAGRYWPCFEFCDRSYEASGSELEGSLRAGYEMLSEMAERYGEQSPALIKDTQLTRRRREVYFVVDDDGGLGDLLAGSRKDRMVDFEDTYFLPPRQAGQHAGHQAKLRVHAGDPDNAVMVLSTVWLEHGDDGLPVTATVFLEDCPLPIRTTAPAIRRILEHLYWTCGATIRLRGAEYISSTGAMFSLCRLHPACQSILRIVVDSLEGLQLARECVAVRKLRLISQTFPDYVATGDGQAVPK